MKSIITAILLLATAATALADWPQWRGPNRNGTASSDASLPDMVPEDYEPTKKWEFTGIPSDHYGGHGSVAIADGKVFTALVWHRDEPTETRAINNDVLSKLGARGVSSLPEEVREKMETDRMNLSRRLRGAALDEWAQKWVEGNLDPKTQLSLGSWIISRFKKGKAAISLKDFDTLRTAPKAGFANQAEMEKWVRAQELEPGIAEQVIAAVPNTKKVADDVVLCLEATTGEEVWKFSVPGYPSGRGSSSTPAFADGKIYAALSEHLYCVSASDGKEIWRAPLTGKKGPASSPLVSGGKVFLQQNLLSAFDAATGEPLWTNKEVKGANPSPAVWKNLILCNSSKELIAVDAETGATVWAVEGGGDGTPVVSGDFVVISSRLEGRNLIAYHLTSGPPRQLWTKDFLARRYGSSPVVHEGYVYHLGSERHLCLDLDSGEIKWDRKASSSISSPLIADGKLLVYENRGGFAHLISTDPKEYRSLGRVKVGALYCASPALVGNRLFLRTKESVACFGFE
ncbi:MAG: PQQ-like beta-propeller repeat protein [Verrucomicrobiales bacterium]|nr:PQQ-like beta-propeller repeat protein [Verrucomicrobiales bacterium]